MVTVKRKIFNQVETTTSRYEEGMDPDNEDRRKYSFYVEAVK
ncbi:MAG: hypothetical protein ACR2GU_15580 [Rubrobacteraceae bacterium]